MSSLVHLNNEIYHITGNHDYKEVTDNSVLYRQLSMPSEYYSFKKQNWVFIMLNTNEVSAYANVTGTEKEQELAEMLEQIKQTGGKQAYRWNGGISRKQMKWLDDLLGKCERNHNNVLIFTHHPLYPQSEFTALNNMEILNTISKYPCVKAVFSGHHHAGAFGYYKGIPMITQEGMIENGNAKCILHSRNYSRFYSCERTWKSAFAFIQVLASALLERYSDDFCKYGRSPNFFYDVCQPCAGYDRAV